MLLGQMFGFGIEKYDDLLDGLIIDTLIEALVEQGLELPKIHWIDG